jgi:hypothetical protein
MFMTSEKIVLALIYATFIKQHSLHTYFFGHSVYLSIYLSIYSQTPFVKIRGIW